MRLALTFNLQRSSAECESEFDTRATIDRLVAICVALGHDVTEIEVGRPFAELAAALHAVRPDLVFNLAEGTHGTFREAFYPALFEQLGLAYTGSDPGVLALCLDKAMTKIAVASAGVPVPRGRLVKRSSDLARGLPPGPLIVKPNFEGASKGITADSVVTDRSRLARTCAALLGRYPAGLLVEELVPGLDVSVAWIDHPRLGVLAPASVHGRDDEALAIYDHALKRGDPAAIRVRVPAPLPAPVIDRLRAITARAVRALGITGLARADYRVTPAGDVRFLEINPLPALGFVNNEELYGAADLAGAGPPEVVAAILEAGLRRGVCQFVQGRRTG